jgi:hypothetical protein
VSTVWQLSLGSRLVTGANDATGATACQVRGLPFGMVLSKQRVTARTKAECIVCCETRMMLPSDRELGMDDKGPLRVCRVICDRSVGG